MFEKRYTKQQIIDALYKAKDMYLAMSDAMYEDGCTQDQVDKMANFAVAVGDVAFEIKCGNILKD